MARRPTVVPPAGTPSARDGEAHKRVSRAAGKQAVQAETAAVPVPEGPGVEQYVAALQQANARLARQNARIGSLFSDLADAQEANQGLAQRLQEVEQELQRVRSEKSS